MRPRRRKTNDQTVTGGAAPSGRGGRGDETLSDPRPLGAGAIKPPSETAPAEYEIGRAPTERAPRPATPASEEVDPSASGPSVGVDIPPSLYARFENFVFLGRGGMGVVYRARDFRLHRDVAIKILFGVGAETGDSLLREARSQARLSHENACKVYEAGTIDHVRFIVMQYIDGDSLDKARSRMSLEEKVRVIRQVALPLHEAHRLGFIHRDVKPSNIMVERAEDGAWKPYIMDFGIAREVGDTGATMTGAIMGTPAFMAPEQALGRVRSLDRRTDVYSLGAALYDTLVGRPPIVAESLIDLLQKVPTAEPPPLRSIDPNMPADLEAIVMKCLEKEPAARYESAKALGEDLQRFLDGDPVKARRASLGYVLLKRARRHKWKVALASAALFVALTVAALWVRARRIAALQASLASDLGESVKEMELFLGRAHGMPLHDIERERDVVRARLGAVTIQMKAAGEVGVGPGNYALGRGHLALQEPEPALEFLRRAAEAGYSSLGFDYAMGVALGELYKQELAKTKRIESADQKKARIAAIEADYKAPALAHLRRALGGAIEAPAYAEGLIAFYEDQYEEALAKAREAFEKAPWLYEAKKLEGDALFALGSKYRHDAAFDYEKMISWFRQAEGAYRAAADLGRSDPSVHEAACELWTQTMHADSWRGESMRPAFEKASAACERAIQASGRSGVGHQKLAQTHNAFAWYLVLSGREGEDPSEALSEAARRAEAYAERSPGDPMAHYLVGSVSRTQAYHARNLSVDDRGANDRAIAGYEEALRLDPGFLWALNELCASLIARGQREISQGKDASKSIDDAIARCGKANELDPGFVLAWSGKLHAQWTKAKLLSLSGQSPEAPARSLSALVQSIKEQVPGWSWGPYWIASVRLWEVTYAIASGESPLPLVASAEESLREFERAHPGSEDVREIRGDLRALEANWLLQRGEDPTAPLREAREASSARLQAAPHHAGNRVAHARIELTALRWAMKRGKADKAHLAAAFDPLLPLLEVERVDPELYQTMADIHELHAVWLLGRGEPIGEEISKGIAMAEKALSRNPRMASAHAARGRLLLLKATQASSSGDRIQARALARQAMESLSAAIRENPLVERTERGALSDASRRAGEEGERKRSAL